MKEDFPAAHSMDTTWFAVDEEGHVAVVSTGEGGGYPVSAAHGDERAHPELDVWRAAHVLAHDASVPELVDAWREPSAVENDARVCVLVAPRQEIAAEDDEPKDSAHGDPYRQKPRTHSVLLRTYPAGFDALAFERAFAETTWTVAHETHPRVLVSEGIVPAATIAAMRAHPDAAIVIGPSEVLEDAHLREIDDGLFHFSHGTWEEPGSYVRVDATEPRAKLQVPPAVVRELETVTLPLRFTEAKAFHLADHFAEGDCATWDDIPLRGGSDVKGADAKAAALGRMSAGVRTVIALMAIFLPIAILAFLVWWTRR